MLIDPFGLLERPNAQAAAADVHISSRVEENPMPSQGLHQRRGRRTRSTGATVKVQGCRPLRSRVTYGS